MTGHIRGRTGLYLAIAANLSLLSSAAAAQSYQCRVPTPLPRPPEINRPVDENIRKGEIAGFTLALSWSPEFCRTRQDSARHRLQCGPYVHRQPDKSRIGDFGFILHGLWPEARGPAYPRWCAPSPPIAPRIIAQNLCRMPSARLMQHEWVKHGTCLTQRPQTYFRISALLFDAVRYPDIDRLSRDRALTVGSFKAAFADANTGLRPEMIRVKRNARGWLQEVRLCLARNYRPARCPQHRRAIGDEQKLKIWRGY